MLSASSGILSFSSVFDQSRIFGDPSRHTIECVPYAWLCKRDKAHEDDIEQRAAEPSREARHRFRGLHVLKSTLLGLFRDVSRHGSDHLSDRAIIFYCKRVKKHGNPMDSIMCFI